MNDGRTTRGGRWLGGLLVGLALAPAARAQEGAGQEERIERLERENAELARRLDVLADELEALDLGAAVAPFGGEVGEGRGGLGPAASKIYDTSSGLSIGGYGEAKYANRAGDGDELDFIRAVLYVGYKFAPKWVFNSEIEFEHGSTGENGEVALEFAYLDYLAAEAFNVRAGLVLVPMGFLNELHEPNTYLAATRPETERRILPSTWRENDLGAYGDVGPLSYRAYVINGFDAAGGDGAGAGSGFSAEGLRGGRQKGSEALADDLAVVGRLDYDDVPGLLVGVSAYHGDAGQTNAGFGATTTTIFDLHAEYKARGVWVRGLAAMARVDDVAALNAAQGFVGAESVGEELEGAYVEAGYDVASLVAPESAWSLSPYARYEWVDTQAEVPSGFASDPANDFDVLSFGINYQPIDRIVFKLEYQDWDAAADRVNATLGYVF